MVIVIISSISYINGKSDKVNDVLRILQLIDETLVNVLVDFVNFFHWIKYLLTLLRRVNLTLLVSITLVYSIDYVRTWLENIKISIATTRRYDWDKKTYACHVSTCCNKVSAKDKVYFLGFFDVSSCVIKNDMYHG